MELETIQFNVSTGWSVKKFPDFDSEQTLILIFAAPEFIDNPAPIKEIATSVPHNISNILNSVNISLGLLLKYIKRVELNKLI